MRIHTLLARLAVAAIVALAPSAWVEAQPQTITIRAARVLDGKGGQQANATVEIRGDRIVAIDQRTGPVTHDLGNVTLLPRMIHTHVHIRGHFNGRNTFRRCYLCV